MLFISSLCNYDLQWFSQKIDHTDFTSTTSWMQQYYVNNQYYEVGQPLLLFLADDSPCQQDASNAPQNLEKLAQQLRASIMILKIRTNEPDQYGVLPIGSRQLSEDLRSFIRLTRMMNNYRSVIVSGTGHHAYLATSLRQEFPNYFNAAVVAIADNCVDLIMQDSEIDPIAKFNYLINYEKFTPEFCIKYKRQNNYLKQFTIENEIDINFTQFNTSNKAKFICQSFGNIYSFNQFEHYCINTLNVLSSQTMDIQPIYNQVNDILGKGRQELGIFIYKVQKSAEQNCGDALGLFEYVYITEAAQKIKQWFETQQLLEKK